MLVKLSRLDIRKNSTDSEILNTLQMEIFEKFLILI